MRTYFAHLFYLSITVTGFAACGLVFSVQEAQAVTPAEQLLPITTKGYLSVPDIEALESAFETIGLGKIINDPAVEPFIEDLQKQVSERLSTTSGRLGVKLEDLRSICAGEVCLALVQPDDAVQRHAVVVVTDITGKDEEVKTLKESVKQAMEKREATRFEEEVAGIKVVKYEVPVKKGAKKKFYAFMFTHDNQLFAADHADVVRQLIEGLLGEAEHSLADVKAFRVPIDRCQDEAVGIVPHVRWFIDPIGYAEVVRDAAAATRKRKRSDMTAAMKAQGYDAVRGVGGLVTFGTEKYEILQNAYVYAPALPKAGDEKYKLAARMLGQSIADPLPVPAFVPDNVSSFVAAAWDIKKSYEYLDTMVDEIAGEEGFFDDLIDSLKNDPNGPQIDIEKDLVAHLGTHVVAYTDAQLPVTPTSERMLLAIELTNSKAMEAAIKKALQTDPDARPMKHNDHIIWEIINEDEELVELEIEGAGEFGDIPTYEDEFADEGGALEALWSNAAISVVKDHLIIASHTDMVIELIERGETTPRLSDEPDYKAIMTALAEVGDDQQNCIRLFSRADRELRTSYELIRQGKMPESEGLIGRLLNTVLAPKEKNATREQEIDGSKMPAFAEIEQHLGPLGIYCRPEEDGWYWAGVAVQRNAQLLNGQRDGITTAEKEDSAPATQQ